MRNSRILLATLILIVAALLIVPGCGPQAGPAPAPSPAPTSATAKPTATPAAAQPKYGGTFRYSIGYVPPGWDAHMKTSYAPVFTRLVFNSLVTMDPNKQDLSPENIVPDLAERWEMSPDGKTFTFFLRKGVKWHNGTPFTADDAVYSIQKMMDPKRSALASSFPAFDSVAKIDDYTMKISLKAPSPSFLITLTSSFAAIQAKATASVDVKTTDFLMGTGPYKYKTSVSGVTYEFVKNPDYFKKDAAGKQLPYLDGIVISIMADLNSQVDAFITKRSDMLPPITGVNNQETADRVKRQTPEALMQFQRSQAGSHLWFNLKADPFKDVRVRRALALVFDQEKLALAGFGSQNFRNTQYNLFSPYYSLPTAEVQKILGWDKPWADRVSQAKALLKDAGYATGLKFSLVMTTNASKGNYMAAFADICRRELGVDVQITAGLPAEAQKLRDAGNYGAYSQGMLSLVTDPDEVMGYLMTGNQINFTGYSNPKLDQLWQEQSSQMDAAKRKLLTQEIERIVWTDVPCLPEGLNTFGVAYWPYVKGYIYQDSIYPSSLQMEQVWLDK